MPEPAPPPPRLRPALVFIGFMGAGKSSAARTIARLRSQSVVDTDALLEQRFGSSIGAFFDAHGEEAFRAAEAELAGSVLERADGGIIALGGGSLLSSRVRAALRRHTAVLLDVDLETAWERAANRGRPLARDRARFAALYAERAGLYAGCAHAFLPLVRGDSLGRALPALELLQRSGPGLRLVWATAGDAEHPVWLGRGVLGAGVWPGEAARRFVVTDETVGALHGPRLDPVSGWITIPPGERHKTLATAERVWRELAAGGMTRSDAVVALGGGVVGDLAGFCAATYQRGVPVVQVPTTLVAQVDSAYGGKTGVDLPEAKNYVGAYHQPAAVLVDPGLLATLPEAEVAAGYAEVLKTALLAGGELWERVRAGRTVDDATILACVRTKLRVVADDERDAGRRQVLNLGHTVGHAIETVTGYGRYRHGEAVGLGLLAALRLSGLDALRAEVCELLAARGLPTRMGPEVDPGAVVEATTRDKKRLSTQAGVPFVLLDAPGAPRIGRRVEEAVLRAAVTELAP